MVRVTHFISLLLFLSPGAIPITREIEETSGNGYFGKKLQSLPCRGKHRRHRLHHSQHCQWRNERTGHCTSCLAARSQQVPQGAVDVDKSWSRASDEEVGVDSTIPCRCTEFGRERALGKGCMGLSDREICETRSA